MQLAPDVVLWNSAAFRSIELVIIMSILISKLQGGGSWTSPRPG